MAEYAFNPEPIIQYIERQAAIGVERAAAIAVVNIQKHAPVRKIFRGTTYRTSKRGFREPKPRRLTFEGDDRRGHANSLFPILVNRTGRVKTTFTGDFRRVSISRPGHLARLQTGAHEGTIGESGPAAFGRFKATSYSREGSESPKDLAVFSQVKGGKVRKVNPLTLHPLSGENLRVQGGKRAVTARGKFEIRTGRANFRSPDDGVVRVGGRLRGEIHATGAVMRDGIVSALVVSATKDPETGRLYPKDQEFGNRHNPPHPFMRPGLHDSRGALRRELKNALRIGKPL